MVQAAEHRMCDDPAVATRCRRSVRDALPDSLMRTSSVEEPRILASRPSEMVLIENEQMIKHLAPQRSYESLRDRVHVRRPNSRLDHPNPNVCLAKTPCVRPVGIGYTDLERASPLCLPCLSSETSARILPA